MIFARKITFSGFFCGEGGGASAPCPQCPTVSYACGRWNQHQLPYDDGDNDVLIVLIKPLIFRGSTMTATSMTNKDITLKNIVQRIWRFLISTPSVFTFSLLWPWRYRPIFRLLVGGFAVRSGGRVVRSDTVHESGWEACQADAGDGHWCQRHQWYTSNVSGSGRQTDAVADRCYCQAYPAASEQPL